MNSYFDISLPEVTRNSKRKVSELEDEYYLKIPEKSSLPKDWKPARGRGRKNQILNMTEEQINEEKTLRLEKNRIAAKNIRERKKKLIREMEEKIEFLEKIVYSKQNGDDFLTVLRKKEERLNILQDVVTSQSKKIQELIEEREANFFGAFI